MRDTEVGELIGRLLRQLPSMDQDERALAGRLVPSDQLCNVQGLATTGGTTFITPRTSRSAASTASTASR